MDNTVLVEQCKSGDIEAYNRLYEFYAAKALHTAYLMVGDKALAEDIVQEAFIQCFQRIRTLKKPQAFGAWFYQILTRLSFRMGSKESKHLSKGVYEDEVEKLQTSMSQDPLQALQSSETRSEVKHALESLRLPIRTVIILYYFNEMSIKEIAEILNCFEGTVKSRLHNGRKQLKALLDEHAIITQIREECIFNADARSI